MIYDLITIGAGSAGYPAGMYASRYGLKNLLIGEIPGGALATSHKVENWPGIISASGKDIMTSFKQQTENSGTEIINDSVESVEKDETNIFIVKTVTGNIYYSKYVILATGNAHKHLNVKGEKEFLGQGVSYCATCDGMFFKGQDIAVIGGGNTALSEALYLSDICNHVYIVHRRDTFRAENVWIDNVTKKENITFILNDEVDEIKGNMFGVSDSMKSGNNINVTGVFVAVGTSPNISVVEKLNVDLDEENCIIVDKRQETNIKGLYAAGDVTTNSNKFRQTIMSAAEGCLAANSVHEDIIKS